MDTKFKAKYFKTTDIQQGGKIGNIAINAGLIAITSEKQLKELQSFRIWRDGLVFEVGKNIGLEERGDSKMIPNRFIGPFTEAELIAINRLPDDVWDEIMVNVRAIIEEYDTNPYEEQAVGNSEEAIEGEEQNLSDEEIKKALDDPDYVPKEQEQAMGNGQEAVEKEKKEDFEKVSVKWLREYLEVKGVKYPNKGNKDVLYKLYLDN